MKRSSTWFSVLPALVIPVCLGLVFYIAMIASIEHGWIKDEMTLRYLIGHPVSKITVAMFFVGISSLMLIGLDVMQQLRRASTIGLALDETDKDLPASNLEEAAGTGFAPDQDPASELAVQSELAAQPELGAQSELAAQLGKQLFRLPSSWHDHYLFQRLASVLTSIYRNGSATHVEEELKYLADQDDEQQQQRYSLVQILIWATPMLGFLGTVLGISQALGGITVGPDNNFQTMMDGLKASLYVAFDTTALALTLSMGMMFGQFFIERFESQLLRIVSYRAHAEIAAHFDMVSKPEEGFSSSAFETKLISTLEQAAEQQTDLWCKSMHWVGSTLTESIKDHQSRFESTLETSIDHSIQGLAQTLGESVQRADQSMSHRWEQWQVMLSENARQLSKNQVAFSEQTQTVCQLLEQTSQQTSQSAQHLTEVLDQAVKQTSHSTQQLSGVMEQAAKQSWQSTQQLSSVLEQTAKLSCQSTLALSDQIRDRAKELGDKLEVISSGQWSENLVAKIGESLSKLIPAQAVPEKQAGENQHSSKSDETRWISVTPEYLCETETSEQVILPFSNPPDLRTKRPSRSVKTRIEQPSRMLEPEVVLPYLKKSA